MELIKEYTLSVDRDWVDGPDRHFYVVKLVRHPSRDPDDVNGWGCYSTRHFPQGGSFGINDSSRERKARDKFAQEVLRLRTVRREAQAEGRFAEEAFTHGSWLEDGEPKPFNVYEDD